MIIFALGIREIWNIQVVPEPLNNYADVFRWTCCNKAVVGAVINSRDYPPRRSPGCNKSHHVADLDLSVDPTLAIQLQTLQNRLREIEAYEVSNQDRGVFIIYSQRDGSFVKDLTDGFNKDKISYWIDEKDVLIGDVIDRAISSGIQMHPLFLIVLSPNSIESSWVQRECDEASHEAAEGKKILLPVLTGGLNPKRIPAQIRRFKCADFNSDFEKSYGLLSKSISTHLRSLKALAK